MTLLDKIRFIFDGLYFAIRYRNFLKSLLIAGRFIECFYLFNAQEDFIEVCADHVFAQLKMLRPLPSNIKLEDWGLILCWRRASYIWFAPSTRLAVATLARDRLIKYWEWRVSIGKLSYAEIDPQILKDMLKH